MSLKFPDRWVWDFWLADDGETRHIFYLQAPRSLRDPNLRHRNATIGHAVSEDLSDWRVLPDALAPGPPGSWDDLATWTGCVVHHADRWVMFYSAVGTAEDGLVQRIGAAESDDLITWRKHPRNPLVEADPRWYEKLDLEHWYEEAWRDPWVFPDSGGEGFHMLITARSHTGAPGLRGAVGHAVSRDLSDWEVLAPLETPRRYPHLEVIQVVEIEGRFYLLFSVSDLALEGEADGVPMTGTAYLSGDGATGPFTAGAEQFVLADHVGSTYGGKIVRGPGGGLCLLATSAMTAEGGYVGEVGDPVPISLGEDGGLVAG